MSLAAARAMQMLADCMQEVADEMPPGQGFQTMKAMAEAHSRCAARLQDAAKEAEEKLGPGMAPGPKVRGRG